MSGIDPTTLPGRAVDIVHVAAQRAGLEMYRLTLTLSSRSVECYTNGAPAAFARQTFRHLGTDEPRRTNVSGDGLRECLTAHVPALGWTVEIWAAIDPAPEADPAALIAEVDAARTAQAAADDDALAVTR